MRTMFALLAALVMSGPVQAAEREATQAEVPAFHLVLEIEDNDGTHIETGLVPTFPTFEKAVEHAQKLHRTGFCMEFTDPPDPEPYWIGACWPPSKIVRIKVLFF